MSPAFIKAKVLSTFFLTFSSFSCHLTSGSLQCLGLMDSTRTHRSHHSLLLGWLSQKVFCKKIFFHFFIQKHSIRTTKNRRKPDWKWAINERRLGGLLASPLTSPGPERGGKFYVFSCGWSKSFLPRTCRRGLEKRAPRVANERENLRNELFTQQHHTRVKRLMHYHTITGNKPHFAQLWWYNIAIGTG